MHANKGGLVLFNPETYLLIAVLLRGFLSNGVIHQLRLTKPLQLNLWGCTVITNLLSAIPWIGNANGTVDERGFFLVMPTLIGVGDFTA